MTDAYRECLEFLYSRLNYERLGMPRVPGELELRRMRRLLRKLGDPQDACPIVHVAGTKGKGSTSTLVAAAATAAGRRTGLFCSPHLHRLEERFQVDGRMATADELVELTAAVMPAVAELDSPAEHDGGRGLTFFEVTTAMGLVHFARRGAELVVLEVGMGGRLDSTNTVRPLVSVITSISLDHMRQLGNTLGLIAREKAGIIKRGRPVVSGVREAEPAAVIAEVARERRVPLRAIGRDFTLAFEPPRAPLERPEAGRFRTRTWARDWGDRPVPLYGPHQALNAAVALATLDVMAEAGMSIGPEAVARGWERLNYPARFEILGEGPWLVIDGAHNEASAQALAETLRQCAPDVPRTLVFGTTREKDLEGQVRALGPLCAQAVATCYLENPRAVPVDEVAEALGRHVAGPVHAASSPAQALAIARRVTPAEGLICVTGSLFLAAECRAIVLGLDEAPALGVGQGGRG